MTFGDEASFFTDTGDFPMSQGILCPLCLPGAHSCCSLSKSNCVIPSIVEKTFHFQYKLSLLFNKKLKYPTMHLRSKQTEDIKNMKNYIYVFKAFSYINLQTNAFIKLKKAVNHHK